MVFHASAACRAHAFSPIFDFPEHHIRVVAPDVGGGFGLKGHLFAEEVVVAFLSRHLGRPVKWIEQFTGTPHCVIAREASGCASRVGPEKRRNHPRHERTVH